MSELFPFCDATGDLYVQGGGENHMYALARELSASNMVAAVTSSMPAATYPHDRFPFQVYTVYNRKMVTGQPEDLRYAIRLSRKLKRISDNFDVIIPQTFIPILATFLSRPSVLVVPVVHDVYQPLPLMSGIAAWRDLQAGNTIRGVQGSLLERFCLHYASSCPMVLTVSDSSFKSLRHWLPRDKIRVSGNGVYPNEFKGGTRDIDVISIARFDAPYKNVDLLCDALIGTDVRTVIVGDGKLRPQIERRYGGSNIHFTGYVHDKKKRELLARSQVLVSASSIEGFGITLLEGLASGCLVTATDIEPHRLIDQGANVIKFFNVGDSHGIKSSVLALLDLSEAERASIRERADELISQCWQWSVIARKTELFLKSVLS